jgi:hypothetical protein
MTTIEVDLALIEENKKNAAKKQTRRNAQQKEQQAIHEISTSLRRLSEIQTIDCRLKRAQDLKELETLTAKFKKEEEISLLAIDIAMSIININNRKQTLRKRLNERIKDEKGRMNVN